MMPFEVITAGRIVGAMMATAALASTVSMPADPNQAFEAAIQWGAIGILGLLLLVIFGFYLPGKDKKAQEANELFTRTMEHAQDAFTVAVKEIEERHDSRQGRLAALLDRMEARAEHQQVLCAQHGEILRGIKPCSCKKPD